MPKVNLGKKNILNPVKQREAFNRLIDIAMARKGVKTQEQLASMLNISRPGLSKRRNGDVKWQYEELCRLFRVLEFEPQEIVEAMGAAA